MPPKKRCQSQPICKKRALLVGAVGHCPHCKSDFCEDHRLPETHTCPNLEECRQKSFIENKAKLEAERTVASKITVT